MRRNFHSGNLAGFLLIFAAVAWPVDSKWTGAAQFGYALGENGKGFPPLEQPLENEARGGLYLDEVRVKGSLHLDSTLEASMLATLEQPALKEAYLSKLWRGYRIQAGLFRGAGLESGSETDELDRITIQAPLYARDWGTRKRLHDFRDYGVQLERAFFPEEALGLRFWLHNSNGQRLEIDQPSESAGSATQLLGFAFSWDWHYTPSTRIGGHFGAAADREWEEFVGRRGAGNLPYWFKVNATVDASLYHRFDFREFELFTEALLLLDRRRRIPGGNEDRLWGLSIMGVEHLTANWDFYGRYEFYDPTQDINRAEALHLFTMGMHFRPWQSTSYQHRLIVEYQHVKEETFEDLRNNDSFFVESQWSF